MNDEAAQIKQHYEQRVDRCHSVIHDREVEIRSLRARVQELEIRFRHLHVARGDGADACKVCGLDLRDSIHLGNAS